MSLMAPISQGQEHGAWRAGTPASASLLQGARQGTVDHRLSGFLLKERSFCFTKPTLHSSLAGALESRLAAWYRPRGTANGLKTRPPQTLMHSGRVHARRGLPTPGAGGGGLGPGGAEASALPPRTPPGKRCPSPDREWSLGLPMRRPGPGGSGWQEPPRAGLPSSRPLCRPCLCGRRA